MKTLIVYDSQFGNTERIAQAMADTLSEYGPARAVRVGQADPSNFGDVDLLVLGCPIQGWKPSVGMRSFLERLRLESVRGLKTAAFDTRIRLPRFLRGSGADVIAARLTELGAKPLLPPEGFAVKGTEGPLRDGEMERAIRWVQALHERYEAAKPPADYDSRRAGLESYGPE